MKLSVSILYSELKAAFSNVLLQKKGPQDDVFALTSPHFHNERLVARDDEIYVIPVELLPQDSVYDARCLYISPDTLPRGGLGKNVSVIFVPGADIVELYNAVLAAFDKYTRWDEALQDLVFRNAPIEEHLRQSAAIVGNSMAVHNNNFAYLAQTGDTLPKEKGGAVSRHGFIDPDFLLRVDARIDQSLFYSKEVIRFRDELLNRDFFFLNLFSGNTAAGRLVVVNDKRPFVSQDCALVQHLGRYLEAALSYAAFSGSGKNLRRDSLMEYLSGKEHSEDKIIHLKTVSPFSKLKEDQHLYCIVGVCQDTDITDQYISHQLERALPESVSVLFDSKIVVLCANQPKQSNDAFFTELSALLKKYSITAGCSNSFTEFFYLRYCYRQAEFALSLVTGAKGEPLLVHFRDHTMDYFLQYGCSLMPARLLCADCILRLAEHDETAAVSYCDSLRIYLNTGMNSSETARKLNIKRNTFLARLERIMRYIDLDLEQEENRLHIQISLFLIRKTAIFAAPEQLGGIY